MIGKKDERYLSKIRTGQLLEDAISVYISVA